MNFVCFCILPNFLFGQIKYFYCKLHSYIFDFVFVFVCVFDCILSVFNSYFLIFLHRGSGNDAAFQNISAIGMGIVSKYPYVFVFVFLFVCVFVSVFYYILSVFAKLSLQQPYWLSSSIFTCSSFVVRPAL